MKDYKVATIGCFDGVHRGHQLLIRRVLSEAAERDLASMVITFDRQPRELFDPAFRPQLLSTQEEKAGLIASMGVDDLRVLAFTQALASLSARAFMERVLRDELGVSVLVTGYDNRFGHDRLEGFDDYVAYGRDLGIEVIRGGVERFPAGAAVGASEAVSSSAIRRLLLQGDVEQAAAGLSRPYSLSGRVVAGEHIGHALGFPTANLEVGCQEKLIPAPGVYAVWAQVGDRRLPAMMNIGTRPTFDGRRQTLEVHVLGEVGDVYGTSLSVAFVGRLREERRFASPEALTAQLRQDRTDVLERLQAVQPGQKNQ